MVSDGITAFAVISVEGINQEGKDIVNSCSLTPISYINLYKIDDKASIDAEPYIHSYTINYTTPENYKIDGVKSILMDFPLPEKLEPAKFFIQLQKGSDIILPVEIEENIKYSTFISDDGDELRITPFTMSGMILLQNFDLVFTMSDGTKVNIGSDNYGYYSSEEKTICNAVFNKLIDLGDCVSLTFNDKHYIKQ